MVLSDVDWPILPVKVMAVLYLSSAFFFFGYWQSYWQRLARPFVRVSLTGALFWLAFSVFLIAPSAKEADFIYRFYLPLAVFFGLSTVEVGFAIVGIRGWDQRVMWAIGLLFFLASSLGWIPYPPSHQVPDGYFFHVGDSPLWFTILTTVIYLGPLVLVGAMFLRQLSSRFSRRYFVYLVFAVIEWPIYWNDLYLSQFQKTWYPLASIGGFFWWLVLWLEFRRQVTVTQYALSHDALTDATSRSYGEVHLAYLLKETTVGIFYFDVNHFKKINDAFGHAEGDHILIELVSRIKPLLHKEDRFIRLGGDEFVLVLAGIERQDREHYECKIKQALASWQNSGHEPIEVSLGFAWGTQMPAHELIEAADAAMYEAKRKGSPNSRIEVHS